VDRAVAQGATLASAGSSGGAYAPPGVLTGVKPGDDVYSEELFGPVAVVFRAGSEEETLTLR